MRLLVLLVRGNCPAVACFDPLEVSWDISSETEVILSELPEVLEGSAFVVVTHLLVLFCCSSGFNSRRTRA